MRFHESSCRGVKVWSEFTTNFILGSYFFEEVTMNVFVKFQVKSDQYRRLLEDHVVLSLRQRSWGFLKDRVYWEQLTNVADLEASIARHVSLIPTDKLCAATDNAVVRFYHVVDKQGMHIEHASV